eukprot:scaffold23056_cov51-Attheya_sp.AAC.3
MADLSCTCSSYESKNADDENKCCFLAFGCCRPMVVFMVMFMFMFMFMFMVVFMFMEAAPGREEKLRLTAARTAGRRPNERTGDDRAAKRIILMVLIVVCLAEENGNFFQLQLQQNAFSLAALPPAVRAGARRSSQSLDHPIKLSEVDLFLFRLTRSHWRTERKYPVHP